MSDDGVLVQRDGVQVREARDSDVPGIRALFIAIYGEDYPYATFLDAAWLKRSVYTDDVMMLVAVDDATGQVLGTASVVFDVGAHSDLLGECGRLAVHPDARGRGVGNALMVGRVKAVEDRLHVAVVENRCVHPFSQLISMKHGFAAVGFLPMKHKMRQRESVAIYARLFGNAAALRRNHPRVIPEAGALAQQALLNCELPADVIIDETSAPYPGRARGDLHFSALDTRGFPTLLRIERGRLRNREVFGPMRLQYGFFKLQARHASYLVARHGGPDGPLAGALGWIHDEIESAVRIFELIPVTDDVVRPLLGELLRRCRDDLDVAYLEVDVSAHAPRMQRTLLELGFLPSAYVPAMVFHDVERLDVVKMVHLTIPLDLGELQLTEPSAMLAERVIQGFARRKVLPQVAAAVGDIHLFAGLNDEQVQRVAGVCSASTFEAGTLLFAPGGASEEMFLLLSGRVAIELSDRDTPVGHVGAGEPVGERALLLDVPHTAAARATEPVEAAVLSRADLAELTRMRPDIGLVVYRNLAVSLGQKLLRSAATGSSTD